MSGAAFASRAACADELVNLRWRSPPGCPESGAVEAQVRGIVSNSPRVTPGLRADGEITRNGGKYRLTLLVFDGDARRERIIESDSCTALAGAAAVALSLYLRGDNSGTDSAVPTPADDRPRAADVNAHSAAASGQTRAKSPPPEASRRAPEEAKRQPSSDGNESDSDAAADSGKLQLVLRAPLGAVDAGLLTEADLSAGAGIGLRYRSWHFGTSVRFFQSETLEVTNLPNVSVSVDRIALDVWGCRSWSLGPFELGPCLTLGIDRFGAEATGHRVDARSRNFLAFAPGAGAQAHLRISDWFALFASVNAGIETSRARLTIDGGVGEVERLGSTRLAAGLGTEWIL
ncbi:MAG: hypothetical protein M3020_09815 [Myxococcota bacterium]|nr:hypothetical protein [Myxococcota bacterium]